MVDGDILTVLPDDYSRDGKNRLNEAGADDTSHIYMTAIGFV